MEAPLQNLNTSLKPIKATESIKIFEIEPRPAVESTFKKLPQVSNYLDKTVKTDAWKISSAVRVPLKPFTSEQKNNASVEHSPKLPHTKRPSYIDLMNFNLDGDIKAIDLRLR